MKTTGFLRQAWLVWSKDLRAEFRERTSIVSVLLFAVTSLVVVAFGLAGRELGTDAAAPLLWTVLFFAAFSGLAHVFTAEEEAATSEFLRMAASAESVFWGKLIFNLALLLLTASVVVPLFVVIADMAVPRPLPFLAVVTAGVIALASAATTVGAIVAKARIRGALFGALGFPIVLPLMMMAVVATRRAVGGDATEWSWFRDAGGLISYGVMIITVSLLIFPIIWENS